MLLKSVLRLRNNFSTITSTITSTAEPLVEPLTSVYTSLAKAVLQPDKVEVLDLTRSDELLCKNLLCENVYDPCACRLERAICRLKALRDLRLGYNRLTHLPPVLWECADLVSLDLSYNTLPYLDQDIAKLQNLEVLKLVGNPITHLPESITLLKKLRTLEVNPGTKIPHGCDLIKLEEIVHPPGPEISTYGV